MLRPPRGERWPNRSPNGNPSGNCVNCADALRSVRMVTTPGVTFATTSAYPGPATRTLVVGVAGVSGVLETAGPTVAGASFGSAPGNVAPLIAATAIAPEMSTAAPTFLIERVMILNPPLIRQPATGIRHPASGNRAPTSGHQAWSATEPRFRESDRLPDAGCRLRVLSIETSEAPTGVLSGDYKCVRVLTADGRRQTADGRRQTIYAAAGRRIVNVLPLPG